jgi:antitoxin component YwqK of YwqJK toxin-antitoxin module
VECIGEYKNGSKTGIWKEYYGNGNIKSQIEYNSGIPVGKCQWFWGNEILKEEFTISSEDSVTIKVWENTGEFMLEKKVPKTQVIKGIYEN